MHQQPKTRLLFLDGLRGIAAVLIVLYHLNNIYAQYDLTPFPFWVDWMISQGHLGVEIFFILSGFVIAYSLRNKDIDRHFLGQFILRRSIRLDPPYWLMIGFILLFALAESFFKSVPMPSLKIVLVNFFYLSDYFQAPRLLPVSWTLALEIQFYFVFVLFLALLQRVLGKSPKKKMQKYLFDLLISGFMLVSLVQNTSWPLFNYIPGCFIYYWHSFFIGSLIAWSYLGIVSKSLFWLNWGMIFIFAFCLDSKGYETCGIAWMIYSVAHRNQMLNFLSSSAFQYLGKISYSLYLVHWLVGVRLIEIAIKHLPSQNLSSIDQVGLFCLVFFVNLTVAHFYYRHVESLFLRLSQMFGENPITPQQICRQS